MRHLSTLLARESITYSTRGVLALGAIGLMSVSALTACSSTEEKESAQSIAATAATAIENAAAESEGSAIPYTKVDGDLKVTVHDLLKPGAEIMVSTTCGESDTHAKLTTSLGSQTADMTPAEDVGQLVGYLTAPEQIGPGPAEGAHTLTVTCDSGLTGTIAFNSAGNGDQSTQK